MNAATQAMNEATQRMANHSFWSTLAIWIGTALLVGTLVLAVLTNKLAVKAVQNTRELGETQVRAYVGVGKCSFILDGNEARVIAEFMNTGKTPATEMRILWGLHFEAGNEGRYVTAQIHIGSGPPPGSIAIVGAGRTAKPDAKKTLTDGQIAALEAGEARLVFAGTLRYTDVFGHPWAQNFQWANGKDYGAFTRDGPMVASKFNEPEREITNE